MSQSEADLFFQTLGKTMHPRMRGFFHKTDPRKEFDKGSKAAWCPTLAYHWQQEGRGIYSVINDGGDTDLSIRHANATFGEWDNTSREAQATTDWSAFNLPRPTMAVWSSQAPDASLHFYWCYLQPQGDLWRWRLLQWRIIQLLNSDPSIENFSRVMRVPGCAYPGKGVSHIDYDISSWQKVDFYELEKLVWQAEQVRGINFLNAIPESIKGQPLLHLGIELPEKKKPSRNRERIAQRRSAANQQPQSAPEQQQPWQAPASQEPVEAEPEPVQVTEFYEDTIEDIKEALALIPPRGAVPGTYKQRDRNILWGLAAALESIGRPREEAVALVDAAGWKDWDAKQVLSTGGDFIDASTFWFHAQQAGYKPKRPIKQKVAQTQQEKEQQRINLEQRLEAAIDYPASEVSLLLADLSKETGLHTVELRGILKDLTIRREYKDDIKSEEDHIRIREQGKRVSELLTLDYLFPPIIANALRVRTRYLPSDAPSTAILYLTGQASLLPLGSRLVAASVSGFSVPLNLFSVLVGQSGSKKTPQKAAVVDEPLDELDKEAMQENKRNKENWEYENKGVKKEDQNPRPADRFIRISKVTPEMLAQQLAWQEQWKRGLLLSRDEFSGLIGSVDQYKTNGKGDGMQQFLELYDGNGQTSLFKTIDNIQFGSAHLCIYSNAQKHLIKEYVRSGDDKGTWARFCMVPLPGTVVALPEHDDPGEELELEAAKATLRQIARSMYVTPIRTLRFCPEARAAFARYEAEQQRLCLPSDDALSSLYGKAGGKVARLAGILHSLDVACQACPGDPAIVSMSAFDRACNLVDYMNNWMEGIVRESKGQAVMDKILEVARRLARPITHRDVVQSFKKELRGSIDPALTEEVFQGLKRLGMGEIDLDGRFIAKQD